MEYMLSAVHSYTPASICVAGSISILDLTWSLPIYHWWTWNESDKLLNRRRKKLVVRSAPHMHVQMGEDLGAVLVPCEKGGRNRMNIDCGSFIASDFSLIGRNLPRYVGPWIPAGNTQKRNFVSQNIFKVKVRCQSDFGALQIRDGKSIFTQCCWKALPSRHQPTIFSATRSGLLLG